MTHLSHEPLTLNFYISTKQPSSQQPSRTFCPPFFVQRHGYACQRKFVHFAIRNSTIRLVKFQQLKTRLSYAPLTIRFHVYTRQPGPSSLLSFLLPKIAVWLMRLHSFCCGCNRFHVQHWHWSQWCSRGVQSERWRRRAQRKRRTRQGNVTMTECMWRYQRVYQHI